MATINLNLDTVAMRKLHREPGVLEYRHKVAEVIADQWRILAPVYTGPLISERHRREAPPGTYKRSVKVEGTTVGNTAFYAHIVEWGSEDTRPHATGRLAAKTVGLRLKEDNEDIVPWGPRPPQKHPGRA